jgi:hypothetical protein
MAESRLSSIFSAIRGTVTSSLSSVSEIKSDSFSSEFPRQMAFVMYRKILSEAIERVVTPTGIDREDVRLTLYDNYSPYREGLLTKIIWAMVDKKQLFLQKRKVIDNWFIFESVGRDVAISNGKIDGDYIELDFREFDEAEIVITLMCILRRLMDLLSKGVKVSSTLLIKIYKLSEMIDSQESQEPLMKQIKQINEGLGSDGNGSFIDSNSDVGFTNYDSTPVDAAISTIYGMLSNITGLSRSALFGEVVTGLGSGDSGDAERNNMALKRYFYSIMFGVMYAVYLERFSYQEPVDIEKIQGILDLIETTDSLTDEAKRKFIVANTSFNEDDVKINKVDKRINESII